MRAYASIRRRLKGPPVLIDGQPTHTHPCSYACVAKFDKQATAIDTVTSLCICVLLGFVGAGGSRQTVTERQPRKVCNAKKTKGLVDANLLTL